VTNLKGLLHTLKSHVQSVLAHNADGSDGSLHSGRTVMRGVDEKVRLHNIRNAVGIKDSLTLKRKRTEHNATLTNRASSLPATTVKQRIAKVEKILVLKNVVTLTNGGENISTLVEGIVTKDHVGRRDDIVRLGVRNGLQANVPVGQVSRIQHLLGGLLLKEHGAKTMPCGFAEGSKSLLAVSANLYCVCHMYLLS
jgi:hypothetical protein